MRSSHASLRTGSIISVLAVLVCGPLVARGAEAPATADARLEAQVTSLLRQRCAGCHGDDAKKLRGGLDLRTRATALRGGDSGKPALVPGEAERSPLFLAVISKDPDRVMPPKESERLNPDEVEALRRWIAGGAPWSDRPPVAAALGKGWDEGAADGVAVATSGG